MRLHYITVDRLQDTCEDDECDCVHRILQHEYKSTHDTSDDRTEGRQDIRKSDYNGDEDDVRKTGDQHEKSIAQTDTESLQDRITDVLREDRITSL